MRVSYGWLREYCDPGVDAAELARGWEATALVPLRDVRRALKAQPGPPVPQDRKVPLAKPVWPEHRDQRVTPG